MNHKHLSRPRRFGKSALCMILVLQGADPLMRAYADDAPIDYSNFRSAEEVRAAALRRVSLVIQASTTTVNAESVSPSELSTSDQQVATGKDLTDVPPANVTSQPEGGLLVSSVAVTGMVDEAKAPDPFEHPVTALAERSLDEIRGGFEMPDSNLKYSFGIERAVYINGELMARTVMYLQNLGGVSGAGVAPQASATANGAATALAVIQNGPGNNFAAQVGPNTVGTVIQNTLDNQKIQNVTTINASVNSVQVMRSMSMQAAVQSGIIGSLRR